LRILSCQPQLTVPDVANAAAWIDAPSEDVPLTVTVPGVWSSTVIIESIIESIVVPAVNDRSW